MRPPFDTINWQQPWLAPLRPLGEPISASKDWRNAFNNAAARNGLRNDRGQQIVFVPQADLPVGMAYEQYISESGHVPTRDNLHDFFNALIWLAYPRIKRQLNAIQTAEIQRLQKTACVVPSNARGPKRDAATLFDENAALVVVRRSASGHSIARSLREHQWTEVFLTDSQVFHRQCSILLFGHALIQKLVTPYKAITAHALILDAGDSFFDLDGCAKRSVADGSVTSTLQAISLTSSMLTPLPVLGVPGWHAVQDSSFYADVNVFRPKRRDRR